MKKHNPEEVVLDEEVAHITEKSLDSRLEFIANLLEDPDIRWKDEESE